ncbi:uncharacterized protein LOC135203834 [Macrobrachium nipponense]|uniref:uncharacterized protein LOC135203834 n=1 Tax=Macrobrachium nipponense TaxID=159736 RepID=UPI0030C8568A
MKSLLLTTALVLIALVSLSKADRRCYNCTGDCVSEDLCDGSCMTITHELGDEPEVRSCLNETKPDGCVTKVMNDQNYKVCYCNTHRCNSSNLPLRFCLLLLLVLLLCFPK